MTNAYLILAEVTPKLDLILPPYSLKGGTGLENGTEPDGVRKRDQMEEPPSMLW